MDTFAFSFLGYYFFYCIVGSSLKFSFPSFLLLYLYLNGKVTVSFCFIKYSVEFTDLIFN